MFAALFVSALVQPQAPGLTVSIARTEESAGPLVLSKKPRFFVAFANGFSTTVTLLTEGCSWGHEMVGIRIMDAEKRVYAVSRVPHVWNKNYPKPWPIGPGETGLRAVDLFDGSWQGLPAGVSGPPKAGASRRR